MANRSIPDQSVSVGSLALTIGIFVILGIPMVFYLWDVLNEALSGRFELYRIALSVPVLVLFGIFLKRLSIMIAKL